MKRGRPKPVSARREVLNIERRAFVADFLSRHPECEAQLAGCWQRASDVHERLNRSQGGRIVGGPDEEYAALCRPCHRYLTDHPLESKRLGFTVSWWDR